MDEIHENKLICYRRIENIIKNIEETEAKTNEAIEAIRRESQSNRKSIGPANDLLRFFYILEQQYQSDSIEIRTKTRENFLEYIDQFRQSDDDVEEDNDDPEPDQSNELKQPAPIVPSNTQPPTVVPQLPTVVSSPLQVLSSGKSQLSPVAPANGSDEVMPKTFVEYQKLSLEAHQYEKRYTTIDSQRKKQLGSRIKEIMNKLRTDTYATLKNELFAFLIGQEQKVANQPIRISNEEERLLCLSTLASLFLAQLLGGDLNDVKTEVFLPLIGDVSENQQQKEFSIIFLDRLHKRCPYTVPLYPKRQPTMDDREYLKAMGYIEKQDGDQRRLETETEFLKRMNGLIRLFCKLLVRGGPPFDKDLLNAWRWFSDVLNLPPKPNITSVLLRVFLDEAGKMMMQIYPNQFPKIIKAIQMQYLPRLEKQTSDSEMTTLRLTLDSFTNKS